MFVDSFLNYFGWTDDAFLIKSVAYLWLGLAVPTWISLSNGVTAPYGRYNTGKVHPIFGFNIPGKVAWIIQESPCLILAYDIWANASNAACTTAVPNMLLFSLFVLHYIHRTLIFPLFLRGKPSRLLPTVLAFFFCTLNGYLQVGSLLRLEPYDSNWVWDPRFIIGVGLFFTGMFINMHSDYTLIFLRKPGETGYKIPRGGMFDYVSGANFFGEILEWTGFAIASWSLAGFAFMAFTISNIGPRARQHHQNYQEKFKEQYPKNRKALIPFLL